MLIRDIDTKTLGRWGGVFLAVTGLLSLAYQILAPFFVPLLWAGILVYITWPSYVRLRTRLGNRHYLAATIMTGILILVLVLPTLWLVLSLANEARTAYEVANRYLSTDTQMLKEKALAVPYIGTYLEAGVEQLSHGLGGASNQILVWLSQWSGEITAFIGGIGRFIAKLGMAMLAAFFMYRHGDEFIREANIISESLLGPRARAYMRAMGDTVQAVVYGLLLTALAQGALAGLSYWVAGVKAPVILAILTAILALVPFGTPLAWGSIGGGLLIQGHTWEGIGVILWGALLVSWVDNILRPLVISNVINISFLLVMLGVLGGLAAFGLVGLFIGPVILGMVVAVWKEWLEQVQHEHEVEHKHGSEPSG